MTNDEQMPDVRRWDYYPIEMPLTADGKGPATVGVDAARIAYEVWDRDLSSHASYDNLPDAINEAMRLNAALPSDPAADLCASGQQVRAMIKAGRAMADAAEHGVVASTLVVNWDNAEAALTPAPQPAQEAVPVAWRYRYVDPVSGKPIWRYSNNLWNGQRPSESQPLYAHPPQPSEKVAEALRGLMAAYKEIADSGDAGFWKAEETPEYQSAEAALRALKGGDANG